MDDASVPMTAVHNHTAYREPISTLLGGGGGGGGGAIMENLRFPVVTMRNSLPRTTKKVLDGPWTWSLCVLHCFTLSAAGQWQSPHPGATRCPHTVITRSPYLGAPWCSHPRATRSIHKENSLTIQNVHHFKLKEECVC